MEAPRKTSYEVVVVGAGVIGLAAAWRAAEAGLSVAVVEREAPGAGASGAAAGMLAPITEAEFREEALLRLNLAAAGAWPAFDDALCASTGADTGYRRSGALVVAADRDEADELRRLYAFQRSLGLESEWLTRSECRRLEPGLAPRVAGGIAAPQDHQVDPRALVAALRSAVSASGGELLSGLGDVAIEMAGGERVTGVRAEGAELVADRVVVAAGPFSGRLSGVPAGALPPVRPVKGQILRLRAPSSRPIATRIVRTPRCYVVTRDGGEVVIGATVEERGYDTTVTADGVYRMLEAAIEVLPDVGELELIEASARLRPGTPDNLPVVGTASVPGLIWATGHNRNGVLLAPLTADAVLRSLLDGDPAPLGEQVAPARFEPALEAAL